MNSSNKKAPLAKGVPPQVKPPARHALQFKPAVAQPKNAVFAQSVKRPVAPPVYNPQSKPNAVQQKTAMPSHLKPTAAAPPVYRPQPTPKVLQTKSSPAQSPQTAQTPRQPVAPPVYRPEAKKMVQPKAVSQLRKTPIAPPVYRPVQKSIAQPKTKSAAQSHTPPKAPPVYRPQAKPVSVQAKMAGSSQMRNHPSPPAVYRPQPTPKVLQTKTSTGRTASAPGGVPQAKRGLNFPTPVRAHNSFKPVVQGYFLHDGEGVFMAQESRKTATGKTFLAEGGKKANIRASFKGSMRVSNDGMMAVEDGSGKDRQAKTFYAAPSVVTAANNVLRNIGSPVRLGSNHRITIRVPNINGTQTHDLVLVYPLDLSAKKIGHEVTIPQRCNEAGPYVGNTQAPDFLEPNLNVGGSIKPPRGMMQTNIDRKLAVLLPLYLKQKQYKEPWGFGNALNKLSIWWEGESAISADIATVERLNSANAFADFFENKSGTYDKGVDDAAREYVKNFMASPGSQPILQELGLNEYINPSIGDLLSIRSIGPARYVGDDWYVMDHVSDTELKNPFGYHYATVIAKSGADYLTMENYARRQEEGDSNHPISADDSRYYFQMFGPAEQSFHAEQRKDYANPMTLSLSPARGPKDYGEEIGNARVGSAIAEYNRKLDWISKYRG